MTVPRHLSPHATLVTCTRVRAHVCVSAPVRCARALPGVVPAFKRFVIFFSSPASRNFCVSLQRPAQPRSFRGYLVITHNAFQPCFLSATIQFLRASCLFAWEYSVLSLPQLQHIRKCTKATILPFEPRSFCPRAQWIVGLSIIRQTKSKETQFKAIFA